MPPDSGKMLHHSTRSIHKSWPPDSACARTGGQQPSSLSVHSVCVVLVLRTGAQSLCTTCLLTTVFQQSVLLLTLLCVSYAISCHSADLVRSSAQLQSISRCRAFTMTCTVLVRSDLQDLRLLRTLSDIGNTCCFNAACGNLFVRNIRHGSALVWQSQPHAERFAYISL